MKICFIPTALDTLSGEHFPHLVHMQENIRALRKKLEIHLVTANKLNAWYMRLHRSRLYELLNLKFLHIIRKSLHALFFLAVYLELKKNINHHQPDLFLVRFAISNYLITRYLHFKGYRVLLEVHALAHTEERLYGQSYAPPFYFPIVAYLEKKMLRWAHQVTAVSHSLASFLVNLGIAEERIHVIHNAVDPDKFDYNIDAHDIIEQYDLHNKTVIGFVGSFARYHGIDMLLDIAQHLHKKYENITFLIVGKNIHGSDNPMEKAFVRRLSHIFTFAGEVPHSRIPLYVAAMDIAVIPDFNTYGSPMKLFEYMAMKKPVVAVDVPPIREVIEDGQTGILFEKGNVSQAAKSVARLIEDERLRYKLGEQARLKVLADHTWDKNAESLLDIAQRMISEPLQGSFSETFA